MKIHELLEKYAGHPVDIDYHGGLCPTQVQATIGDYHLYYRARHGEFTVCVADTFNHAVEADRADHEGVIYFIEGDDPTEGYVPEETYTETVDKAIEFTLMKIAMDTMTKDEFTSALDDVTRNIMNDDSPDID